MASLLSIPSKLLGGGLQKAKIIIEGMESQPIPVQFNPEQYVISEQGHLETIPSKQGDKAIVEYIGGVTSSLKLTFYFDTSVSRGMDLSFEKATDVSLKTKVLSYAVRMDGDLHRQPMVAFAWGSLQFQGFVKNVNTTYTMFTSSGMPVRAKVDVEFEELFTADIDRWSPLQSPDRTKARIVTEDSNLWDIANREYGDMSKWKIIAKANGIMNPLDIAAGTTVKVPAITD